jgi:hypothetical protein
MRNEETIREFFSKKPGYLKSGVNLISRASGVTDHKLIKRIKKELSSTNYRAIMPVPNPVIENINITPELIEALQIAIANGSLAVSPTQADTVPLIQPKRPRDKKEFKTAGIHLLMGCSHVPFHNQELHNGIRSLISDLGDDMVGFHLMGDWCDINTLSSHDRGKFTAVRGLTLESEYIDCEAELNEFEKVLPKTVVDKSFMYGNHEDRVFRHNKDMQNAKNPAVLPHVAMGLREKGYAVHTNWSQDYITIGNEFEVFHGIYFNVHCAKAHVDKLRKSCAFVHTHRQQSYREGDLAAYNIGACADFNSAAFNYATRPMKAQWSNGFAIVNVDASGEYFFQQIDVKDNRFYYNGRKY